METEESLNNESLRVNTQDSPITPLTELAKQNGGDSFPATLSHAGFIVGTGAVTLVFPALVYYSVLSYGLLASGFMATGYEIWRFLARRNPKKAKAFLIGFTPIITLTLISYGFGAPSLVAVILVEFLAFYLVMHALDQFRLMR